MNKKFIYGIFMLGFLGVSGFMGAMQSDIKSYWYKGTEITLSVDNIERQSFPKWTTSAIVNAAKPTLMGGGGIDGAIHKAAGGHETDFNGASIKDAPCEICAGLRAKFSKWSGGTKDPYCKPGNVIVGDAHQLTSQGVTYIIHTVGPNNKDRKLLAQTYKAVLEAAVKNGITHVAFPQISVGFYGYPVQEAVPVVVETIKNFIEKKANRGKITQIRLVMYNDKNGQDGYGFYREALDKLCGQPNAGYQYPQQPYQQPSFAQPVYGQQSQQSPILQQLFAPVQQQNQYQPYQIEQMSVNQVVIPAGYQVPQGYVKIGDVAGYNASIYVPAGDPVVKRMNQAIKRPAFWQKHPICAIFGAGLGLIGLALIASLISK